MKTLSRRGLFGAAGCIACGAAHLGFNATPVGHAPGDGVAASIPGWSEEVRPPRQAD